MIDAVLELVPQVNVRDPEWLHVEMPGVDIERLGARAFDPESESGLFHI